MPASAADIIASLGLEPHPEGGWYRETWRAPAPPGARASASAIHFLLDVADRSHWHAIDAAELWLWHAGSPLTLSLAAPAAAADAPDGAIKSVVLGPDVLAGHCPPGAGAARTLAGGRSKRRLGARQLRRLAGVRLRRVRACAPRLDPRTRLTRRRWTSRAAPATLPSADQAEAGAGDV